MNNLYRDLAPITEEAWTDIELEATRTFKRHIAGRRVVDVSEPGGPVTAAIRRAASRGLAAGFATAVFIAAMSASMAGRRSLQ